MRSSRSAGRRSDLGAGLVWVAVVGAGCTLRGTPPADFSRSQGSPLEERSTETLTHRRSSFLMTTMMAHLVTTVSGCCGWSCCCCCCNCWWFWRICSWRKTCCCFRILEAAGSMDWLALGLFCLAPPPVGKVLLVMSLIRRGRHQGTKGAPAAAPL